MSIKKDLGKKIRDLREQKNLTREAFCDDELELTVRQLARIESGESLPTLPKLTYISQKLSVPIHHLIDEKHMELPREYLAIKYKLCKIPTYRDPEKIRQREEYFDEIYERFYLKLPEEEQLTIDVLQTLFDVYISDNVKFGEGILEDYFFQIKNKTEYSINELLIIRLYFGCVLLEEYDSEIFYNLLENVIEQTTYSVDDELFHLNKILIAAASIMMNSEDYDGLKKILSILHLIMKKTRNFQQKPILNMLEGKYFLYKEGNLDSAKEKYHQAIACADMFEDHLLSKNIEKEWEIDYLKFFETIEN